MIVKMTLIKSRGGGAVEREIAKVESINGIECLWQLTEPWIIAAFEGRDFAYFEAEGESERLKILRRANDPDPIW